MTIRNFRQYAIGLGSTPAQVVFQIDGNTVFSGSVTTLDQPMPSMPDPAFTVDNLAWTWQDDVEFAGTKSISISVSNSSLLLAGTSADNPYANVETYGAYYTVEIDGVSYADPLTNEAIDGVSQTGPYDPDLPGEWWWYIPAGSTFTATMHVNAPLPPTAEST